MTEARPNGTESRRRRGIWLTAAVAASAALVLAACGSSGGGSSSTSAAPAPTSSEAPAPTTSSAPAPVGDPVKVMTIADINSQGSVFPMIHYTATAAQDYINKNGGVGTRPIQVINCDAQGTAEGVANCTRQAVQEKVVAVVGSFDFFPDASIDILEPAGIAYFGACCMLGTNEFQSKIAFPLGSHQMYGVGFIKKAQEIGCKKAHAVIIQGAEGFFGVLQAAATNIGFTALDPEFTVLPATATDYAPQVAESIKGGTDCILGVVTETSWLAFMPAWNAAAPQGVTIFGPQGNLDSKVLVGNEATLEGSIIVGAYPDISCPAWDSFRQALTDTQAPTTEDYNSLGGLGTWTAYMAFKQLGDKVGVGIDAATFLKASPTAIINLPGMIPDVNFAEDFSEALGGAFTRMFNTSVVYSTIKGGAIEPLGACDAFDNVGPIIAG
ncbi:MAG: ABC transporter substrate-binding protein [Actinobacteria bacterium]|nr:ABC transporter substrate-binding protein [Actinomycetota bacterium]